MPQCYGSWQAVYSLFHRWQRPASGSRSSPGCRRRPMLPAGSRDRSEWVPRSAGRISMRRAPAATASSRPNHPAEYGPSPLTTRWDGSQGGWSTELRLVCERGQRMPAPVPTAGQRGGAPQFLAVLAATTVPRSGPGRPRTRPEVVRADKAYSSRAIRTHLRPRSIPPTSSSGIAGSAGTGRITSITTCRSSPFLARSTSASSVFGFARDSRADTA
ncbi:hypothetical protein CA984_26470 [Streptosporangium minutum]|uniref:Transposase IS4-like domain-containing protein n=1 Tax=Streptosporangium minutum TaxID=569862 RepID=A0A243RFB2_9ACTN|nr:hypothetical protein CA984_26470 [Streptosporangium minutum]